MREQVALTAALVSLLPGGSLLGVGGQPEPEPVGELVAAWSEADHKTEDLRDLADPGDEATYLLRDGSARDGFLTDLPPGIDGEDVRAVDMEDHVLVVGSYHQCVNQGGVNFDAGSSRLWFEDFVAPEDEGTVCDWSPLTVEVWAVPHTELGDTDPGDLHTGPSPPSED